MNDTTLPTNRKDTGSVFRDLSVRQKIAVGFGGLLLLMTASIGFTLVKLADVSNITHSVIEERQPTANLFQRLNQDLNLASGLLTGYLLTGESELREEYDAVEKGITKTLKKLRDQGTPLSAEIPTKKLQRADVLFGKFRAYADQLYALHDNNANNRGLLLAEETLNESANMFIGDINALLASEDIDLNDPKMLAAYRKLQNLRYTWVQMMSSLRTYIITQNVDMRTNFDIYNNHAGELLADLNTMDIEIGFGELEEMTRHRKTYVSNLQPVFNIFSSDNWRSDSFLIKTELRPVLEELRSIFESIADEQLNKAKESGTFLTAANEQIQFSTVIILAVALLIGMILAMRITSDIVPPIQRLMIAAKDVAQGDLNAEVMITHNDEIGQLGASFNAMVNDLRNAAMKEQDILDELQELNQSLENRVADRTKELKQSEIKIRAILDNIGEGIVVLNENGKIESMNPAAEQIFTLKEKESIGLNSALLIENYDAQNFTESGPYTNSDHITDNDDDKQPKEHQGIRSNGDTFPMEMVISGMNVGNRRMRVCIVRDITARKETEDTLADVQSQLVDAAHKSGMADMATGVLHNIGNILNSVNLSGDEIHRISSGSKITGLMKATDLLVHQEDNMQEFLTKDARGQKLPDYFIKMGKVLNDEISQIKQESKDLLKKTTMMKEVISTQQAYAKSNFHSEQLNLPELVDDAIKIQEASLKKWGITLNKNYTDTPMCTGQKSKLLQVITNLIKNAKEAMDNNDQYNRPKEMNIETGMLNDGAIYLKIEDNGCGINGEQLTKIFNHGFTTKKTGHGFGLHTSANAMTEMKGALKVDSGGVQKGACFTVTLPISKAA